MFVRRAAAAAVLGCVALLPGGPAAQSPAPAGAPKLVVVLVVDQMRTNSAP